MTREEILEKCKAKANPEDETFGLKLEDMASFYFNYKVWASVICDILDIADEKD